MEGLVLLGPGALCAVMGWMMRRDESRASKVMYGIALLCLAVAIYASFQ